MPSSRRSVSARGGAKPAEDGRGSSTAQTRAQELGTAMLNAARPVLSARLNNQGYPIPITAKEVFTFLEQLAAYNGRTKDVMDNALVLEQVDDRVKSFLEAYPSLRYLTTDEDDDNENPKPLLVYDEAWNPKVSEGREACLKWDKDYILPALRAQFTSNKTKTEMESVLDMLKGVKPTKEGPTDWATMRMLVKAFLERREQDGTEGSEADDLQLIKWVLEGLKPNWPGLVEYVKRLPKKESPTEIVAFIDEMAGETETFFKLAHGPMKDYLKYLNKEKPEPDQTHESTKQPRSLRFDSDGAGSSRGNGQGSRGSNKQHNPDIICGKCKKPGHIARICPDKEATYPRSEQKEDKSGNNAATGGKGKGKGANQGKAGSVSAVAPNSAEQNSDDWESWNEYQDYRRFCARRRGKP